MERRRFLVGTALVLSDGAALAALCPDPRTLATAFRRPHQWIGRTGTDAALATLAGAAVWLAAAWLALGLLSALAVRLPGSGGRCAARVSRALLPRAIRGLVAGSAGVGVLLTPVAALAAPAPGASVVVAASLPSPAWPVDPAPSPAPIWPSARPTPASPAASTPEAPEPAANPVTVHRGDTLWLIAGRRLGPQATPARIAAEWPRWFRANRAVIGPDAALIRPGQVLQPPAPSIHPEEGRP